MRRQHARTRERLLASLDAYIEAKIHRAGDADAKPKYSAWDRVFVVGIIVAAVLIASVVLDALSESAEFKARYETVLTWAVTILAGLLGGSFESAEKMLPGYFRSGRHR